MHATRRGNVSSTQEQIVKCGGSEEQSTRVRWIADDVAFLVNMLAAMHELGRQQRGLAIRFVDLLATLRAGPERFVASLDLALGPSQPTRFSRSGATTHRSVGRAS